MKLTKSKLKQIIKEELGLGVTEEGYEGEHPGHKDYLEFPGMWDDSYPGVEVFWDDLNKLLTDWDDSHEYSDDLRNVMVEYSSGGRGLEEGKPDTTYKKSTEPKGATKAEKEQNKRRKRREEKKALKET